MTNSFKNIKQLNSNYQNNSDRLNSLSILRILVIDNNNYLSRVYNQGLRNFGAIVYLAQNYKEAVGILNNHSINVISVNLDYGNVSNAGDDGLGFDILSKLYRELCQKLNIIWTASSISNSEKTRKKALSLGVDLYFIQPVAKEFFIKQIHKFNHQSIRSDDRIFTTGKVSAFVNGKYQIFKLRDISLTGLAFYADNKFVKNDLMTVVLSDKKHHAVRINARIVRIIDSQSKLLINKINNQSNQQKQKSCIIAVEFFDLDHRDQINLKAIIQSFCSTMSILNKELNSYDNAQ